MSNAPILFTRPVLGKDYGRKVSGLMVVRAGLHYIKGNSAPHFSITADVHQTGRPERFWACGAMHDEILRYRPSTFDLLAMHLRDMDGSPMHAVANGLYWLAGCCGGLGQQYHGGSGQSGKTPAECLRIASEHFLVPPTELDPIRLRLLSAPADQYKPIISEFCETLRPMWSERAAAAIDRYGLVLFGDVAAWHERVRLAELQSPDYVPQPREDAAETVHGRSEPRTTPYRLAAGLPVQPGSKPPQEHKPRPLPDRLPFEGLGRSLDGLSTSPSNSGALSRPGLRRWTRVGYREPKQGEFYVSGAIPAAYRAPNDLPSKYLVVRPIED
jgi:hypothetical protein